MLEGLKKLLGGKDNKKASNIIIVVLCVLIVGVYLSTLLPGQNSSNNNKQGTSSINVNGDSYAIDEKKLSQVLSGIKGAGKVEVMVTYESSPEVVPALIIEHEVNTVTENGSNGITHQNQSSSEHSQPVTVEESGDGSAMIIKEIQPQIRGVIVVAQGADSISVRMELLRAVQTVFNIPPEKVEVFAMNE